MKRTVTITNEEIERRYAELPSDVLDAFESVNTSRRIFEIGKMRGLAIDKIGDVARIIGYLMLGFIPANELTSELAEIIGDKGKAGEIAVEINQKILLPIRESLKKIHSEKWDMYLSSGAEKAATAPPIPQPKPTMPPPSLQQARPITIPSKPVPTPPAPPPQPKPAPPPMPEAPKGPQPLIIHPLPREQQLGYREQGVGIIGKETMPKPTVSPVPTPSPLTAAGAPPKPAPTIGPLGVTPVAPPPAQISQRETWAGKPPASAYERAKQEMEKEFETFRRTQETKEIPGAMEKKPPPPSGGAVSPYIITKEQLQKMVSEKRVGDRPPEAKPEPQKPVTPPPSSPDSFAKATEPRKAVEGKVLPPLKLPPQKIPKPPAPERYVVDPYREPTE
ncbi:MAG: hypothetical protein HY473_01430 [Candidatus Sungbacteria bacterium]|uniref:Uncharacterized protein n=1 Tax=Candidatus Sungiibacteriota bacterium TaxID=2750080 RepID=A0A933DRW2_9BACT|nr:hypothetical protein [Candidatus Sungbacteria bacterium]